MKTKRTMTSLAILTLSAPVFAQQFMIDDFTSPQSFTMGGFETTRTDTLTGIDLSHGMFGMRTISVTVQENFFNMPIDVTVGNGTYISSPRGRETWATMAMRYDDTTGQGVDMSVGHVIRFKTANLGEVTVGVIDIHGNKGSQRV